MVWPILTASVRQDGDVVQAHQRTRIIAEAVGFGPADQTRLATAISEIARNAVVHGHGGVVEFSISAAGPSWALLVRVADQGSGIPDLRAARDGHGGLPGRGLSGAQRLLDRLDIVSSDRGTIVTAVRTLPPGVKLPLPELIPAILDRLALAAPADPYAELRRQNFELLQHLDELGRREEALLSANQRLAAATATLHRNIAEKEVLLREVYHRVKNNLQIISSLLSLQAARIRDPAARGHLDEIRSRVLTISLIHDRLYQSPDMLRVVAGDYLRALAAQLWAAHQADAPGVALTVDTPEVELLLDDALQLGLLFNEGLSAAFRHARGATGRIAADVTLTDGWLVVSIVHDLPVPPGEPPLSSLAQAMIRSLAQRLDGTVEIETRAETRLLVRLPLPADPGAVQNWSAEETRDGPDC